MSGRERQAPDIAAQSLEARVRTTKDTGWVIYWPDSCVLPSTAPPLLPPQTEDEWYGAAGQRGGEDLGEMSREKMGDYSMD